MATEPAVHPEELLYSLFDAGEDAGVDNARVPASPQIHKTDVDAAASRKCVYPGLVEVVLSLAFVGASARDAGEKGGMESGSSSGSGSGSGSESESGSGNGKGKSEEGARGGTDVLGTAVEDGGDELLGRRGNNVPERREGFEEEAHFVAGEWYDGDREGSIWEQRLDGLG